MTLMKSWAQILRHYVEDSAKISLCQNPSSSRTNFWSVSDDIPRSQEHWIEWVYIICAQSISVTPVLIFYIKTESIILVIAEISPKHERYTLELYILFRPYESCYPSRILIGETENTLWPWLIKLWRGADHNLKSANLIWCLKDLTWKHFMIFFLNWLQM